MKTPMPTRQRVLNALRLDVRRTAAEVAASCKMPLRTVRPVLSQLKAAGLALNEESDTGALRWYLRGQVDFSVWPAWAVPRAART